MLRAVLAIILVVGAAPVWAQDLADRYRIQGTNPGGAGSYMGQVAVARNGDVYQVAWAVGDTTYLGTGLLIDGVFSVVYAPEQGAPGIAAYRVLPDGMLVGRWVGFGGQSAGTENWTPDGGT